MDKESLPFAHSLSESFADYPAAAEFPEGRTLTEYLDYHYSLNRKDGDDSDKATSTVYFNIASRIIDEPDGLATYALLLKSVGNPGTTDSRLADLQNLGMYENIFRSSLVDELKGKIAKRMKKLKAEQSNGVGQDEEIGRNLKIIFLLNQRANPTSQEGGKE